MWPARDAAHELVEVGAERAVVLGVELVERRPRDAGGIDNQHEESTWASLRRAHEVAHACVLGAQERDAAHVGGLARA